MISAKFEIKTISVPRNRTCCKSAEVVCYHRPLYLFVGWGEGGGLTLRRTNCLQEDLKCALRPGERGGAVRAGLVPPAATASTSVIVQLVT